MSHVGVEKSLQLAPRVLDLRSDDNAPDGPIPLVEWAPGLFDIATADEPVPELVITAKNAVNPPWNALWQEYPNWGHGCLAAFSRQQPGDIMQRATRVKAERIVEVRMCPMTPDNLEGADAVFLEADQFHRHDWPTDLLKIVNLSPDCVEERVKNGGHRIVAVDLFGLSMGEALQELDAVCRDHKVRHLATIPFGRPDEAAELDRWATESDKAPERMTFLAELPGDFVGLTSRPTPE